MKLGAKFEYKIGLPNYSNVTLAAWQETEYDGDNPEEQQRQLFAACRDRVRAEASFIGSGANVLTVCNANEPIVVDGLADNVTLEVRKEDGSKQTAKYVRRDLVQETELRIQSKETR